MCYNCGCGNPQDDMGDLQNITADTFVHLAKQWKISQQKTKQIVYEYSTNASDTHVRKHMIEDMDGMFEKAAKAWGQSVEEAKKQTLVLLQRDVKQLKTKK